MGRDSHPRESIRWCWCSLRLKSGPGREWLSRRGMGRPMRINRIQLIKKCRLTRFKCNYRDWCKQRKSPAWVLVKLYLILGRLSQPTHEWNCGELELNKQRSFRYTRNDTKTIVFRSRRKCIEENLHIDKSLLSSDARLLERNHLSIGCPKTDDALAIFISDRKKKKKKPAIHRRGTFLLRSGAVIPK